MFVLIVYHVKPRLFPLRIFIQPDESCEMGLLNDWILSAVDLKLEDEIELIIYKVHSNNNASLTLFTYTKTSTSLLVK